MPLRQLNAEVDASHDVCPRGKNGHDVDLPRLPRFPKRTSQCKAQRATRLGYVEGQNLVIERYSGEGRVEIYPKLARDAATRDPDLLLRSLFGWWPLSATARSDGRAAGRPRGCLTMAPRAPTAADTDSGR